MPFDFINNEKLKSSSFAVEGKTVNGYKTEDGNVAINIDSAKSLNSVVGHEITHILEGTELYSTLQEVAKQYAEAKGEYATRMQSLRDLYTGVYKGTDFDTRLQEELTADIVGDYLFTDSDFINNLSTEQPTLFKKIYNEVKYLCKVATAGTKEARELEKLKKSFEDAWKQNGTAEKNTTDEGGVRYSLRIKYSNGTIKELDNARQLTDEQAVEYLEKAKSGELFRDSYIPIRKDTPQVIIDSLEEINEVIENNSLIIQVSKARQAMNTETSNKKAKRGGSGVRGHSLTPTQIVEIMNNLDNPNAIIYQTNRVGKSGDSLPNNVAVFVEYDDNGKESVAIIEFDSSINPEYIGKGVGDENYHTVVTIFEPDTERDGIPYDYMDELLSNPNNYELEIVRRQPTGSATGEKHPNTSNELPSTEGILPKKSSKVKGQYSLNNNHDAKQNSSSEITDISFDDIKAIERFKNSGYKGKELAFAIDRLNSKLYLLEGKDYYEKSVELYSKYQEGKANKENFFYETIAKFEPRKNRPRRTPDYISRNRYTGKVSSEYWYTKEGVIRGSDHWGEEVASCDWYYGDSYGFASHKGFKRYGFVKWEDILYKTNVVERNGKQVLRSFANSVGKGDWLDEYSLSSQNSPPTEYGTYNVHGTDVAFAEEDFSIRKDIKPQAVEGSSLPLAEDEANAMLQEQNSVDTFSDGDAPPEFYTPDYDTDEYVPESPLEDRDIFDVGRRPSVKAYMYENPEVKSYFQFMAYSMLLSCMVNLIIIPINQLTDGYEFVAVFF